MKKTIFVGMIFFVQLAFSTITYNPTQPNVEQSVNFTVNHIDGIYPPSIFWDFGDGTNAQGSTTVNKTYTSAGYFLVVVNYRTLKEQNITEQVTINVVERRRITFTPLNPTSGRDITFRAENFLSNQILWDFGDGTEVQCLQNFVNHRYERAGRYIVTARDWCGDSVANITTTINVGEEIGPRAPFQISFIQLRFEDGKPYKSVLKDSPNLMAYADIKYEGTGVLIAQWEVDGVVFKQINKMLPYAEQATIDSGKIPSIPTNILGIHDITLRIIQPQIEYPIPVIRYFVSAEKYEFEKLKIPEIEAITLDGESVFVGENIIKAPIKKHIILKGSINNNTYDLDYAILRIYLDKDLIDQRLFKNFKKGERKEFETSIILSTLVGKRIYIAIYDIEEKTPKLIYLQKFFIEEK